MLKVNILDAKNRLSALIRAAAAGEEVVIANRGAPVARLVPVPAAMGKPPGSAAALLAWLEGHRLPPHARRTPAEIDAAIAEERRSWD